MAAALAAAVSKVAPAPESARWRAVEHGIVLALGGVVAAKLVWTVARREGRTALVQAVVGSVLAAARAMPGGAGALDAALEAQLAPMVDELAPRNPEALVALPADGLAPADVEAAVRGKLAADAEASGFRRGTNFAGIYHDLDTPLTALQGSLLAACLNTNLLYPGVFKSARSMEAEVVAMAVSMLKGADRLDVGAGGGGGGEGAATSEDPAPHACGLLTTGGTESVMIAIKAYRDAAREARGWALGDGSAPLEVIAGVTAHPALDKACAYFDLKLVKLPVDDVTQRMQPAAVAAALTSNTIAIYASAPTFPHGAVDPIPELAALAARAGCVYCVVSTPSSSCRAYS